GRQTIFAVGRRTPALDGERSQPHSFFTTSEPFPTRGQRTLVPMSPRNTSRAMHPGQVIAAFLAFLLFAGVGGVLAAGLVMPVVAATGSVTPACSQLFHDLPDELGSEEMSEQSVILERNGKLLARFYMWNRIVVPMEKIDPLMGQAVIAIEDHRFFEHGGIDTEGLMRAAFTNLSG